MVMQYFIQYSVWQVQDMATPRKSPFCIGTFLQQLISNKTTTADSGCLHTSTGCLQEQYRSSVCIPCALCQLC